MPRKLHRQDSGAQEVHEVSLGGGVGTAMYGENTVLRVDQIKEKVPTPPFVYILTFFSAIGGFLFGYDTGVISGAMISLRERFLLNSVWQEMIVSVTIAGAALFAIVGGILNDKIGRKLVIIIASLVFTAGSLCLGFASDKFMLLTGRIIVGAGIGESYILGNLGPHSHCTRAFPLALPLGKWNGYGMHLPVAASVAVNGAIKINVILSKHCHWRKITTLVVTLLLSVNRP